MPKNPKPENSCYLIGELTEKLNVENLPTKKEVLSRFIYCRTNGQESVSQSIKECGTEVENIWTLANISTQNHYRVLNKVNSLHSEWTRLKKNKSRKTDKQRESEELFVMSLDALFDISYNDSLRKMQNEDKERLGLAGSVIRVADKLSERSDYWHKLLQMQPMNDNASPPDIQCDGAPSNDVPSDTVSTVQESDHDVNSDVDTENISKSAAEHYDFVTDMILAIAESDVATDSDSDDEYLPPNKYKKKTSKQKKPIMTPDLAEALNRTTTGNRSAVYLMTFAAVAMGLNPENMVINRESFRQSRLNISRENAIQMRKNFEPDTPLVLHWDGKLLSHTNLEQKVDRITVVVTGHEISQTLEIPYLSTSAKGKTQAELVMETVRKWTNVEKKIEFLCFDTTNVNSGQFDGTCIWLEKLMGRRLLWLACRHHIMELNAAIAFKTAFDEKSKSGNIHLFEEFRKIWPDIDKSSYESCCNDYKVLKHILPIKEELIAFVNNQLKFPQFRDDYRELLVLTLLVIGEKPPDYKVGKIRTYVVHTCGALHRARWMIYSLKIYLYRSQFILSDKEQSGLQHFVVFVITVYIKNWYQAPCTLTAAKNDIQLLKDLAKFESINPNMSALTLEKFSRHLWYLSEELVGFASFDNTLDVSEKRLMVKALKKSGCANPAKRVKINLGNVSKYRISDFVTSNSLGIFSALGISREFLNSDPMTWPSREDYNCSRNLVKRLKIVNDVAERGIATATKFNGQLTVDDEQWEDLILGVEHNRKLYPNSNKKTVLKCIKT